jgi:hypothetical protein
MAGRFRGEKADGGPHLAHGVAEKLRSIADDVDATAEQLATERVDDD